MRRPHLEIDLQRRARAHDQRRALHLIVQYFRYVEDDHPILFNQIYDGVKISRDQFEHIWKDTEPNAAHVSDVAEYIVGYMKDSGIAFPEWLISVAQCAFPGEKFYTDYISVFNSCASRDIKKINDIKEAYLGVYTLYRYAAHLTNSEHIRVVRAAMRIYEDKTDKTTIWPKFSIKFRPQERSERAEKIVDIGGKLIVGEGKELYFTGVDVERSDPIIIVVSTDNNVTLDTSVVVDDHIARFTGIVTRRHPTGNIISSRVVCVRRTQQKDQSAESLFKSECALIGIYTEPKFTDEIRQIEDFISNKVDREGKGVLIL